MVDAMRQEHVILLNEQDQPCGTLEKYAAHTATTPLHSAFSCWIFNELGQLLVTRRSLHKKPGLASGPTLSVVTRSWVKPTKPLLSAGLASNWVQTSTRSAPCMLTFVIALQTRVELWKTKCARFMPHIS